MITIAETRRAGLPGTKQPRLCATEKGLFILYYFSDEGADKKSWHAPTYDGVHWEPFPWKVHNFIVVQKLPLETLKLVTKVPESFNNQDV